MFTKVFLNRHISTQLVALPSCNGVQCMYVICCFLFHPNMNGRYVEDAAFLSLQKCLSSSLWIFVSTRVPCHYENLAVFLYVYMRFLRYRGTTKFLPILVLFTKIICRTSDVISEVDVSPIICSQDALLNI